MRKPKVDYSQPVELKKLAEKYKEAYDLPLLPGAIWLDGMLYIYKNGQYERRQSETLHNAFR